MNTADTITDDLLFPAFPKVPESKGDWRPFTGDGTAFLTVPNLKKLRAVKIGTVLIPLSMPESYPVDGSDNLVNQKEVEVPLVKLTEAEDGTPVSIRSIKSNDGVWQQGATIYIDGEWKKETPASATTASNTTREPTDAQIAAELKKAGFDTAEKVKAATDEQLLALPGFTAATVEKIRKAG